MAITTLIIWLTIHPGNNNGLKTGNDEETGSTGTIGVNQLEKDDASLKHNIKEKLCFSTLVQEFCTMDTLKELDGFPPLSLAGNFSNGHLQ